MTSFIEILKLAAGVGIFMVGIVMFSECMERNASSGMRALFKKISDKRAAGVGIGAGVTAIIQSSSATTVMVIGLVNAGILSLFQATAIIMGANIGTTVTGLLVSLYAVKVVKYIFMSFAFIGAFVKLITKKESAVKIADLLISFGILFVGLELISNAMATPELTNFFTKLFNNPAIQFPLLLILLGAVFTAVIHSSSAATAIFLVMIGSGVMTFNNAIYLVMGANIGTCVTAYLVSLHANANAKRAALTHVLFNTFGTVVFAAIFMPLGKYIIPFYQTLIPHPVWQLAVFHVIFNTISMLMLVGFIRPLNKLTCMMIKDKPGDRDMLRTTYIDERLLTTPTIALDQTKKEIMGMARDAQENLELAVAAMISQDLSDKERINKTEVRINFLNQSLARYLVSLSASKIGYADKKLIGGYHHVINDIERIGDHAANIFGDAEKMKENGSVFSDRASEELKAMYARVCQLFDLSLEVFQERKAAKLKTVSKLEEEIDEIKKSLENSHVSRLTKGECTVEGGEFFCAALSDLERVADHLTNIAFTIRSYTGSQKEAFRVITAKEDK